MSYMPSISKSESSYIRTSLHADPPVRADGRSLTDYRIVFLETGVAPLANGSARINVGKSPQEGGGGTEVIAAVKLEVEDVEDGEGVDGGRVVCTVSCFPSAYPQLSSNALDELSYDYTTVLHQTLSHPSLHPSNLGILPRKKSWLLNLDVTILSDEGNAYDVIFMAARAALWDTKVPRTRGVQYARLQASKVGEDQMDTDKDGGPSSHFDTRKVPTAADFELPDYWDEGEILDGRERWPVCITLNMDPPVYYLDATSPEEASTPLKLLFMFSFPSSDAPSLQAMRFIGSGEIQPSLMKSLISDGEKHAKELFTALDSKLRDEDVRRNQRARQKFTSR